MQSAQISFPELSPRDASIAAQELREMLLEFGVPASDVGLARSNPDAQDIGGIVTLASGMALTWIYPYFGDLVWEGAKGAAGKLGEEAMALIINALKRKERKAEIRLSDGRTVYIGNVSSDGDATTLTGDRGSLGVVLLGASEFTAMPRGRGLDNSAFAKSAALMKELLSERHTVFKECVLVDLFNRDVRKEDIAFEIEDKIAKVPSITDVVIYYCGHGHCSSDDTLVLLLKGTKPDWEEATGLPVQELYKLLSRRGGQLFKKRCYFIYDCCYAAMGIRSVVPAAGGRTASGLPRNGSAFLTATGRTHFAISSGSRGATKFTGALADAVFTPSRVRQELSLEDVHGLIRQNLTGQEINPQCQSLDLEDGNIAKLPFFVGLLDKAEGEPSSLASNHTTFASLKIIAEAQITAPKQPTPPKIDPTPGADMLPSFQDRKEGTKGQPLNKVISEIKSSRTVEQTATPESTATIAAETLWYIARDGKQHGPLSDIEMRTFVGHNYLRPTDLCWRPGMADWLSAPAVFPRAFNSSTQEPPIAKSATEGENLDAANLREKAEKGDAEAQWRLGDMYLCGKGVVKDYIEAARLFRLASEQENAEAEWRLGMSYLVAKGVERDVKEAVRLLRLSSARGNAEAQWRLGDIYRSGDGVPADQKEAAKLYRLSSQQENDSGRQRLAFMYEQGLGVEKDEQLAATLYISAADGGNHEAQRSIGQMYEDGRGIKKDLKKAARYYHLAADQGNSDACWKLHSMYEEGRGVKRNPQEALRFYDLAKKSQ